MMSDKRLLLDVARRVLALSKAEQTEVIVTQSASFLTRFANNVIHQNVGVSGRSVQVRSVLGKRVGVATANAFEEADLARVTAEALTVAQHQPQNPDFQSLPGPGAVAVVQAYDPAVAACAPQDRAQAVKAVIGRAEAAGAVAAGAYSTETSELLIVNSLGVESYHPSTDVQFRTVVTAGDGAGYAAALGWQLAQVDPAQRGERAVAKCLASRSLRDLPAGAYTVVLEPEAVGELVMYLAYIGFGAKAFQEQRSFMAGHIGQRITGDNVTIYDDGHDPAGVPMPFDFEGVPKQRVAIISSGVAEGVVYDSLTAAREGKTSTGHALPASSTIGPMPWNLHLAPGASSLEEMIAATDRGILVTRFHYTNVAEPTKAVLTGMTRDGTFLIEGGKVAAPVKNLRYTQSVLEAFARADLISRETERVEGLLGVSVVPAMRVREFNFTGTTQF
jgi:PmbA protein